MISLWKIVKTMMKKLFFIFLALGCTGAVGLYSVWQQATQLPDWYTTQPQEIQEDFSLNNADGLITTRNQLHKKIEAAVVQSPNKSFPKQVEIELSNHEINEIVMTKMAQKSETRPFLSTIRQSHTTVNKGIIESGAVVNLADLPRNQLSANEIQSVDKVLKTFPFLENKDIYVGISGQTQLEQGHLKWDNNTKVKLGKLSLSIDELSQRLGIPTEKIYQNLNAILQVEDLNINELEFKENEILLRGSVD